MSRGSARCVSRWVTLQKRSGPPRSVGFGARLALASIAVACAAAGPPVTPATGNGTVYHLFGFSLSGTNRVDSKALIATLPQHKGDVITQADIREDTETIRTALAARHVHGDMTTATLEREGSGHDLMVVWEVHLADALSYTPPGPPRHLAAQSFSGNAGLSTEQLIAATGLQAGQAMPDGSVGDARTGIEQAYNKALPGVPVTVRGKVKLRKDKTIVIDWHISERPGAPPPGQDRTRR